MCVLYCLYNSNIYINYTLKYSRDCLKHFLIFLLIILFILGSKVDISKIEIQVTTEYRQKLK